MSGKILKITFEFEDEVKTLFGADAEEWENKVDGMCCTLAARNMNPFDTFIPNWVIEKKA